VVVAVVVAAVLLSQVTHALPHWHLLLVITFVVIVVDVNWWMFSALSSEVDQRAVLCVWCYLGRQISICLTVINNDKETMHLVHKRNIGGVCVSSYNVIANGQELYRKYLLPNCVVLCRGQRSSGLLQQICDTTAEMWGEGRASCCVVVSGLCRDAVSAGNTINTNTGHF